MDNKKIPTKTLSQAIKDFKSIGNVSESYLMRKYKLNFGMSHEICIYIAKRFPNLWANRMGFLQKKNSNI